MKWLLLSGISGCSLGGTIGTMPSITYLGPPPFLDVWNDLTMPRYPRVLSPCRREALAEVPRCSVQDTELRLMAPRSAQTVLVFTRVINPPGLSLLSVRPFPGSVVSMLRHLPLESAVRCLTFRLVVVLVPTMIQCLQQTTVLSPPDGTFSRQLTPEGSEWKH